MAVLEPKNQPSLDKTKKPEIYFWPPLYMNYEIWNTDTKVHKDYYYLFI